MRVDRLTITDKVLLGLVVAELAGMVVSACVWLPPIRAAARSVGLGIWPLQARLALAGWWWPAWTACVVVVTAGAVFAGRRLRRGLLAGALVVGLAFLSVTWWAVEPVVDAGFASEIR